MPAKKTIAKPSRKAAAKPATNRTAVPVRDATVRAATDPAVDAFMQTLKHPMKSEIERVRRMILDAHPDIREGIKWNAPSFRTTDYFATFHLRGKDPRSIQMIFHTGAKVKSTAKSGVPIKDSAGLIEWLAKDRCMVTLGGAKEIKANAAAFRTLVREWIRFV